MQSHMLVPTYYQEVVEIIKSSDWLLDNFNATRDEIYNAVNYQHNLHIEGLQYTAILDVNVLQYLINIVKKTSSNPHSRIAAAYLVFFQIAEIQLDPSYAIYEKICYNNDLADEAITNLELFNGINNHRMDELAEYAFGDRQQLHINPIYSQNRQELKKQLIQYKRLTDWDSLYLCILSITKIHSTSSSHGPSKLLRFVEWSIGEFRFSIAALVYAASLFGKVPAKKMMKYKIQDDSKKKRAALFNMTWDLYYIDRYMKSWVSGSSCNENLMLTADKALRVCMQLAIDCQKQDCLEPLRTHIGDGFNQIELAYNSRNTEKRIYRSTSWNNAYRENLIKKYESEMLRP